MTLIATLKLADWANIATIIASFVGLVTLFFIYRKIKASNIQSKRERAFHFVQKYYDKEHMEDMISTMDYFRYPFASETEKWNTSNSNPDVKKSLRICFNFFEELGLSYNKRIVDREIIELLIGEASLNNYSEVEWFIRRFQDEDLFLDPDTPEDLLTYIYWVRMNRKIQKNRIKRIGIYRSQKKIKRVLWTPIQLLSLVTKGEYHI